MTLSACTCYLLVLAWAQSAAVVIELEADTERLLRSGAIDASVLKDHYGIDDDVRITREGVGYLSVSRAVHGHIAIARLARFVLACTVINGFVVVLLICFIVVPRSTR
jgi:hypothetical protein